MEPLRIHLFGGFLLERGETALPPIASRAGRTLFARLVMERGRPLSRVHLAGVFWPDLPEGRARRRLSHTLWQIQDVVGDVDGSHLVVTPDTLAFDTDTAYWLDVEEFDQVFDALRLSGSQQPLGRADDLDVLRRCVELYRGDFLAGYFDDWALVEQEHYRERYRIALGRLVEVAKAHRAYDEALAHARRLTHHDPLREEAHQEVMRLCFLLGRVNDAIQQYERCRSVLEEELGAEPSRPTVELYRRILHHRRAPTPVAEGVPPDRLGPGIDSPFVGRVTERRGLLDLLDRALGAGGGVVLVEGEPGVGKTRLAREVTDDARWRGFEVVWGSCRPGTLRPFAPIGELLESLSPLRADQLAERVDASSLARALPLAPGLAERTTGPAPGVVRADPSEMIDALVRILRALGTMAPHVLIVDDVHWADPDTLTVLSRLGAHLEGSRILLLLLYRSEEGRGDARVWDTLRELDRVAGIGRVVLPPLTVFELGEMVQKLFDVPAVAPSVVSGLHKRTGGNALFTLETLLALRDHEAIAGDGSLVGRLSGESLPVADRVRSVIHSRLSLLGEEASAVLTAAAVHGDAADVTVLAEGAQLPRAVVLDAVADLLHRRLLEHGETGYRITHDHTRQVVYEHTDPVARAALHRRLGHALLALSPDDAEALSYHFSRGGDAGRAWRFHREAGRRAERIGALETAERHFREAIRWVEEAAAPADLGYDTLGDLERVLGVLGRRDAQAETIEAMAGQRVVGRGGDLERRRAWLAAHLGEFELAEASARRSVSIEGDRGDLPALAASLVVLGTCIRWSGRPLEAIPHLRAALETAAQDDRPRAEALTELGSTLVEVQQAGEALPHLEEAGELFRRLADVRGEAEVDGIRARASRQLGDIDGAVDLYGRALERCREIGYRHGVGVNLVNLGTLHYLSGRPVEAITLYDRAASVFDEIGDRRGRAMVLANAASVRHSLLGDDQRARADAERAMEAFAAIGDRAREAQCQEIVAGVLRRQGDVAAARTLVEQSLETLAESGNRFLEGQHLRSLALLELEAGDHPQALSALERADRLCFESGLGDLAVELTSIRGAVMLAMGRIDDAVASTGDAVARLDKGVESAHLVHHRHALALETAGRTDEAREAARLAAHLLEESLSGLSEEERRLAVSRVPEHLRITEGWRRLSPRIVVVRLPSVDAPTGRPLRLDELVEVTWTVEDPDDRRITDRRLLRRHRLLRLCDEAAAQGAAPAIEQLAEALGVSGSTVRRDLSDLRDLGHGASTRGRTGGRTS